MLRNSSSTFESEICSKTLLWSMLLFTQVMNLSLLRFNDEHANYNLWFEKKKLKSLPPLRTLVCLKL